MITLTHPSTLEQRRDILEDLVKRWDDMPAGARDRMLHEVTTLRGEPLRVAMEQLQDAIVKADKLTPSCDVTCRDCETELAGVVCDPQHEPWLLACGYVAVLMSELLRDPVVTE